MSHLPSLPEKANLVDVYKAYPKLAKATLSFAEAAVSFTDELSKAECELLGTYVSALNECTYCQNVHAEVAAFCEMDREKLANTDAMASYGGDRWAPIFAYVKLLTLNPASVTETHVQAILQQGWSEDVVVQITALASTFAVLNRTVEGLGLQGDSDFFKASGERLGSIGYGGTMTKLGL